MCQDPPCKIGQACGELGMVHHMVAEVGYDGNHARLKRVADHGLRGTWKLYLPWLMIGEDISCTMYC